MNQNNKWNETHEIIVIGSGFAGLSAAIEACLSGAKVLVLEKMSAPGGNSIISDGGIAAPGTELQKKHGIIDSPLCMYEDMLKAGLGINNSDLVKNLTVNAKEAFEWSVSFLGVEYLDRVDIFGGHSIPRCYTAKNIIGSTIIKKLIKKIHELGIELRLKTFVKDFILTDDGGVSGVVVQTTSTEMEKKNIYLKATKGVIIATGGFASDIPFRQKYDPRLTEDIQSTNKPFATAEVLQAAMDHGAATVDLGSIQLGPWASPDETGYGDGPQFSEYIVFQYGIIIDPYTGKRFINELCDRKTLSDSLFEIGHPCIGIADSNAVSRSGWNIEKALIKKVVRKFNSIEEISAFYTIEAEALQTTITEFNHAFIQRKDPLFSKTLLEDAFPLINFPFYVIRLWPKVHFTMGGLKINTKAEVLHTNNTVIPRLYAAGEVTGGVHGASRLGSCSITDCFVFGRIAGKNAAKN